MSELTQLFGHDVPGTLERVVHLHCYNAEKNHDKFYYLGLWKSDKSDPNGLEYGVSTVHGRRGSKGQYTQRCTRRTRAGALADLEAKLSEQINGGYIVQSESKPGAAAPSPTVWPSTMTAQTTSTMSATSTERRVDVYTASEYAKNPPRYEPVTDEHIVVKYQLYVLNSDRRILVHVDGASQTYYDGYGGVVEPPTALHQSLMDLEGDFVLDGFWNGETYVVVDAPAQDTKYEERFATAAALIDGTVGPNVVIATPLPGTTDFLNHLSSLHRHGRNNAIVGFIPNSIVRPGQKSERTIIYKMRPRAKLQVIHVDNVAAELGLDDGFGLLTVANVSIGKHKPQVGDTVEIEYESWAGHGHLAKGAELIGVVKSPVTTTVQELLTIG